MVFTGEDISVFQAYLRSCERSRELMRQHGEVLHQQELNIATLFERRASTSRAFGHDWLGMQDLFRQFGRANHTGRNGDADTNADANAESGSANSTFYIPLYEVNIPLHNGNGSPLSRLASAANAISTIRTAFGTPTRSAAQTQRGLTSADISRNCSYIRFGEIEAPLNGECPITQEAFGADDTVLQIRRCRHNYHAESLLQWFRMGVHCPLCRDDLRRPAAANAGAQRIPQTSSINQTMNEIDIESELAVSLEPIARSNETLGALLGNLFTNPPHLTSGINYSDGANDEDGER